MLKKIHIKQTESLHTACILSVLGGFLDVYSYLYRGKVFANAITGNIVLFGLNLADKCWTNCGKYLYAIIFYAIGVLAAEFIRNRISDLHNLIWQQAVLGVEILCMIPVMLLPQEYNSTVNALIAFICALQVQTFRCFHGNPFASTMCTGNLRSGSEALWRYIFERKKSELIKAVRYYQIILFFIIGAVFGTITLKHIGTRALLIVPLGLLGVLLFITPIQRNRK